MKTAVCPSTGPELIVSDLKSLTRSYKGQCLCQRSTPGPLLTECSVLLKRPLISSLFSRPYSICRSSPDSLKAGLHERSGLYLFALTHLREIPDTRYVFTGEKGDIFKGSVITRSRTEFHSGHKKKTNEHLCILASLVTF